jgi:hypothetical protein
VKTEALSRKKLGKREYLNNSDTKGFMKGVGEFFDTMVEIPRIRVGKR